MPVELVAKRVEQSRPIHVLRNGEIGRLAEHEQRWLAATGFKAEPGQLALLPAPDGSLGGAVLGLGDRGGAEAALLCGTLGRDLPAGDWHFESALPRPELAALAACLGAYRFTRYADRPGNEVRLALPNGIERDRVSILADGICLARDLINTPASDLGPEALESAARELAGKAGARCSVIVGEELLERNLPMIHAVGRAASQAPRLIDLQWGNMDAPKVTLVGKGVCFDTGGLDIKPSSSMLLMKKDMGGAANVLGLASMIMRCGLHLRLRVLIPAVENSIAGAAFRPGDILRSRKGLTVEIGNTDAEGRLVLADALALADEEAPELIIDMATLTGAARVALGPDLPPFFTQDEELAATLGEISADIADPMWRMPLWRAYGEGLSSKVADLNNVVEGGFAGAITAALFLQRFVEKAGSWVHFDIYAWNPKAKPHAPVGGEAQCIRSLFRLLQSRYP